MQTETASDPVQPARIFMIPPPLMFAIAFGVGVLLDRFAAIPLPRGLGAADYVGWGGLILGVCLGVSLAATFLIRRTTLNPFANPSAFVASGPYRLSRNPMYVSLTLTYLGGAILFGSVWPLATLLIPILVLSRVVIPFEEARMLARFGEGYRAYCGRVRRWL